MLMITDAEIIQQDEEQKITEYTVTGKAQLAGDSIWEYEGPLTVTVDSIREVVTTRMLLQARRCPRVARKSCPAGSPCKQWLVRQCPKRTGT